MGELEGRRCLVDHVIGLAVDQSPYRLVNQRPERVRYGHVRIGVMVDEIERRGCLPLPVLVDRIWISIIVITRCLGLRVGQANVVDRRGEAGFRPTRGCPAARNIVNPTVCQIGAGQGDINRRTLYEIIARIEWGAIVV